MIRINLLGTTKPKKGKGARGVVSSAPALPQLELGQSSILIFSLLVLVIAVGGSWYFKNSAEKEHEQITRQLASTDLRIKQLSAVKAAYEEKQKQATQLKKRFDVIDQLRAAQSGPVTLLNALGDTVSKTDAVWVNTMSESGNKIDLDGIALTHVAVANLMTNLRKSGFFDNVELKETVQEDYRGLPAFKFTLSCQRAGGKKA